MSNPLHIERGSSSDVTGPAPLAPPQYSPDGAFFWDGTQWHAVPPPPPPVTLPSARPEADRGSPRPTKALATALTLAVFAAGGVSAAVVLRAHDGKAPVGDSGCTPAECGSDEGSTGTVQRIKTDPNAFNKGLIQGRGPVTQANPNFFCTDLAKAEGRNYPDDPSAQSLYLQGCLQGAAGG